MKAMEKSRSLLADLGLRDGPLAASIQSADGRVCESLQRIRKKAGEALKDWF